MSQALIPVSKRYSMEVKRFLPLHAYLKAFQTLDPSYSGDPPPWDPAWADAMEWVMGPAPGKGQEQKSHRTEPLQALRASPWLLGRLINELDVF